MDLLIASWPFFVSSLVLALGATPAIRNIGVRLNVLDGVIDSRRVHARPVPRLGGIAIVIGTCGGLMAGLVLPTTRGLVVDHVWTVLALTLCAVVVAAAGLYDDVMGARALKKLAVQLAAAILLYAAGFHLTALETPFGGSISVEPLSFPLTLLWVAAVTNAVNLIDGLDGLAAGIAAIAALALCLMGARAGQGAMVAIALALAGATLGFLVFNINPATIFMGDSGSLFLGTVLAALPLWPVAPGEHAIPVYATALVLGVPLLDVLLAVSRRAARGSPLFSADREHLHHRLLDTGMSQRASVAVLWCASAILAAIAVYLTVHGDVRVRAVILAALCMGVIVVLNALGYLGPPDEASRARRRRNRELLRNIRGISARISEAASLDDIRRELDAVAPVFEAEAVRLSVKRRRTARHVGASRAVFPLDPSDPRSRIIELEWSTPQRLDRDAEVAVEMLCRRLSTALDRLERHGAVAITYVAQRDRDVAAAGDELRDQAVDSAQPPELH